MPLSKQPWKKLKNLIEEKDSIKVINYLEDISAAETARAISRLNDEDRSLLMALLEPKDAADVIEDLSDEQAAGLLEEIPTKEAAAIMDKLPGNIKANILSDMKTIDAQAILDTIPHEEAQKTRELLKYKQDTAGGIMETEFLSYADDMTVDEILTDLKEHGSQYADYSVQYAYIISSEKQLKGVLRLRDLLLSPSDKPARDLIISDPVCVKVDTSLDDLIQLFEKTPYFGIPVIDGNYQLLGVVRRSQVNEASGKRSKNDYLKASGIIGGEELRSMPLWLRAKRRLSWLSVNIFLNIIAASVIAFYQDTLAAVIALAVFLPIISDMSGCSGSQAVAVSIRELAMGLVKPFELSRVLFKEMSLGVINGVVLGILLGLVAFFWKGNPYLGLVVGGALTLNTVVAVTLGGAIPLILKRMGKDPALASGPILTTVTDMCGFFFALGFATATLPLLK